MASRIFFSEIASMSMTLSLGLIFVNWIFSSLTFNPSLWLNLFVKNFFTLSFVLCGLSHHSPLSIKPLILFKVLLQFIILVKYFELRSSCIIHLVLAFCLNSVSWLNLALFKSANKVCLSYLPSLSSWLSSSNSSNDCIFLLISSTFLFTFWNTLLFQIFSSFFRFLNFF